MKKLYLLLLLIFPLLVGCTDANRGEDPSGDPPGDPSGEGEPGDGGGQAQDEEVILKVDYLNDGGANIPTSWNDDDTGDTIRKGSFEVRENTFEIEFVGKWYNSTNKQEFQTKKDPVSYVRAASDLVVKKVVVETFSADMKVYLTNDHTGNEVNGKEVNASHGDGSATEYELNSKTWSILAFETYKGSNINIYSFTFYF